MINKLFNHFAMTKVNPVDFGKRAKFNQFTYNNTLPQNPGFEF